MKYIVYTFYNNYNYGSLLQCYALQECIKEMGFSSCVVSPVNHGLKKEIKRLLHKIGFGFSCIRYPERFIKYKRFNAESHRSSNDMSEEVKMCFDEFIQSKIEVITLSDSEIHGLSKEIENYRFITGSDQVWGIGTPYLNPNGFLRSVIPENRYSYAASFGADTCPDWNKKKLARYLKGMRTISVRETTGINIVNSLGMRDAQVHIDPVFLIDRVHWRQLEQEKKLSNYYFIFTLNDPSTDVLDFLTEQCKDGNVYYGPYKSERLESIVGAKKIEFSPQEFLWLIDHADYIFTDSFHAMAFSIIFLKPFCVFERNYQHGMPQNNRITSLLCLLHLDNHYLTNNRYDTSPYNCDELINSEREKAKSYLSEVAQK